MQIETQDFLRLVEDTGKLAFFDIESTGFHGDYNSVLCVSILPYGGKPYSYSVVQPGNDQRVVREVKEALESYQCIAGFYSKGFDLRMLNTRLLKWKQTPIKPLHHIDMYYSLKYKLNTSRKSQAHFANWLKVDEQKMSVSADVWSEIIAEPSKHMPKMIERCESDVCSLRDIYDKTKHLIGDIRRG